MPRVRIIKFRRNSNKSPTIMLMAKWRPLFINKKKKDAKNRVGNHYNKFT